MVTLKQTHTYTHTSPLQPTAYKYYTHTHTHVPCTKFHSKLIDKKCFCLYIFCLSAFPISIPRKDSKFWSLIVRFLAFHTLSLCISLALYLPISLAILLWCSITTTNQRSWPAPTPRRLHVLFIQFALFFSFLIWTILSISYRKCWSLCYG